LRLTTAAKRVPLATALSRNDAGGTRGNREFPEAGDYPRPLESAHASVCLAGAESLCSLC
jgi:hypothetical protein